MNRFLFATVAVGEKYNKRLLDTLFLFDKLGYNKDDKLIIFTDRPELYDNDLNITTDIIHYNESDKFQFIDHTNFRDNTMIKLYYIAKIYFENKDHNVITWYDADAFPIIPKSEVINEKFEPGFYFRDCHLFDSLDSVNPSLKERYDRYKNIAQDDPIALCEGKYAAPVETILTIVDNFNQNTKRVFKITAWYYLNYNLHNYLNDCYSESAELSYVIGKSFGTCNPIGRSLCTDNHIMPDDSIDQDREKLLNNDFIREYFTSNN